MCAYICILAWLWMCVPEILCFFHCWCYFCYTPLRYWVDLCKFCRAFCPVVQSLRSGRYTFLNRFKNYCRFCSIMSMIWCWVQIRPRGWIFHTLAIDFSYLYMYSSWTVQTYRMVAVVSRPHLSAETRSTQHPCKRNISARLISNRKTGRSFSKTNFICIVKKNWYACESF